LSESPRGYRKEPRQWHKSANGLKYNPQSEDCVVQVFAGETEPGGMVAGELGDGIHCIVFGPIANVAWPTSLNVVLVYTLYKLFNSLIIC
jgi:hypothetical protein